MKKIMLRKSIMIFISLSFLALLGVFIFRYTENAEKWAFYGTNRHVYTNGDITNIGDITDSSGVVLAYTKDSERLYNNSADIRKATVHIVGDRNGYVSTGVQYALRDRLTDYSAVNGLYTYSAAGNNMQLTLNSAVCVAALKALNKFSGCVGMYNYKTGEVLCMVSAPAFDVDNDEEIKRAKSGEIEGVFVNRFLSSTYTPGSTFKTVTAAASFSENGEAAYDIKYNCNYGTIFDGEKLSCVGRHNEVTLKRAFSHSCNAYFSQLAVSLGKKKMTIYAEMFGFNKEFSIDGIKAATSHYDVGAARDIDFGWSGIGQYTNMMNPLQYLCAVGAVANGGEYVKPYIVKNITSSTGKTVYEAGITKERMLSKNIADKVADLMDYAVSNNYKKTTFGNLDVCGKTGTAEVGNKVENSVFVGFCKDEELPVAFVVVVEGGGAGKASALNVANKTLQAAAKILKR